MKTTKRPVFYEVPKFRVRCISGHKWLRVNCMATTKCYALLHLPLPQITSYIVVEMNDSEELINPEVLGLGTRIKQQL